MYIFNKKQINQNKSKLNISEFVQSRVRDDFCDLFNKLNQISSNLHVLTFAEGFWHENLSFV